MVTTGLDGDWEEEGGLMEGLVALECFSEIEISVSGFDDLTGSALAIAKIGSGKSRICFPSLDPVAAANRSIRTDPCKWEMSTSGIDTTREGEGCRPGEDLAAGMDEGREDKPGGMD